MGCGFLQVVFFFCDWCGVWVIGAGLWCLDDWCLVFDGLGFFFFFFFFGVDGRLWVASGGGGVRCVWCSGGRHVVMVFSVKFVVVE